MSTIDSLVIPISLGIVSAFILKGNKPVLVDTGYRGTENEIIKQLTKIGVSLQDIAMIIITHGHNDHFGNAKVLRRLTGTKIAIHKLDAENLRKGINGQLCPIGWVGRLFTKFAAGDNKPKEIGVEPDILIEDVYSLEYLGIPGKVVHTPGHTPGSISIVLDNGEIIIGDLLTDFLHRKKPSYPMFANDIGQLKKSIKMLMSYSPHTIFASHGGPFNPRSIKDKF